MSITSTLPTSRRGYLSQLELEQFANIAVTETNEADDVIGQAEEIIDSFVGFQCRFMEWPINGMISATNGTTLHTLQIEQINSCNNNYFAGCEMEVIGGKGAGQRRKITASTFEGVLTTEAFTTTLDTTSIYKIYQLGKFPRQEDVYFDGVHIPNTYYKAIPENIKRAVAAQVEYIIQMGDAFFKSDKADKESESIGDYSYSKGSGGSTATKLIAPKARMYLQGITNRKGVMIA